MALPAISHFDERRYAFHLMNVILGGNASSRLFQELREKRGVCYSVSSHPLTLADSGVLNVSIGLDRRNLEKSLSIILGQFANLCDKPVGAAELRRAKEYAVGSSRMALERASSQNMRIGSSVLIYGKIVEPSVVHEKLRAVTAEEVRDIAKAVLDPARITMALVGPDPDTKMIRRMLGL